LDELLHFPFRQQTDVAAGVAPVRVAAAYYDVRKFDGETCVDAGLASLKKVATSSSSASSANTAARPGAFAHARQNSLFAGLRSDSGGVSLGASDEEEEEEDDDEGAVFVQQALISFLPTPQRIDNYSLTSPRSSGWSVSVDASRGSLIGQTVSPVTKPRADMPVFLENQPFFIAFAWKFKRSISASTSITAKFTLDYTTWINSNASSLSSSFTFTDDGLLSSTVGEIIAVPQGSSYPGSSKN
jgi:hypothetical protein